MNLDTVTTDPAEAAAHVAELTEHLARLTPEEHLYLKAYEAIAAGRKIISLSAAIAAGGCFDSLLAPPLLAVAPATARWVYLERNTSGGGRFMQSNIRRATWRYEFRVGTLPRSTESTWGWYRAMVPPVPVGIRYRVRAPKHPPWRRCLTLFEVGEWAAAPMPPGDPALIHKLAGDLYTVEAEWDLTDLERTVLAATRLEL